jgi:hypothetical protein
VSLVSRLPVPVVPPGHPLFERVAACAEVLAAGTGPAEEMSEYADLQAMAGHLYRLRPAQFEHILSTFPLVPRVIRERALQRFIDFH